MKRCRAMNHYRRAVESEAKRIIEKRREPLEVERLVTDDQRREHYARARVIAGAETREPCPSRVLELLELLSDTPPIEGRTLSETCETLP